MCKFLASYLYTLLSFALCSSVFSLLTLGDKAKRTVTLAGAVLFFSLAISPLSELISAITELDVSDYLETVKSETQTDGEYIAVCEDAYCEGVRIHVSEKFSLEYSDVSVSAEGFDFETMSASRVKIFLKNKAVLADSRAIEDYVFRSLGVLCTVEVLL